MGADGHVFIYDLELLTKEFPNQQQILDKPFFYGYKRRIFDHDIITQYTDYDWHELTCAVCGNDECEEHEEQLKKCLVAEWEVWT